MLYARTGKEALLAQTCESLTRDFGSHPDMPSILAQIGDECLSGDRFGVAVPIYQYIVEHWPKEDKTVFSAANMVSCLLCLKNDAAANVAFADLQNAYSKHPNLRQAICTIGDNLRWRNLNPQAARQAYTLAASGDPYPEMIWARMGLAISCVRLKDFDTAGKVVEGLAADFGNDLRIGQALCHTADAYRDIRSHGDARRLYQYVVDHYPSDEYAMWSQAGIAVSAIDSKDVQAAQAAIEKLRTDHANRPEFAGAVCVVADNYRWREGFAKAKDLYALAATASPNHRQGIWFQMGLAICSICVNDPNTAAAAIARLHDQYRSDPGLPQAVYEVAATFGNAKLYDKATAGFNEVISTWPDSDYAMLSTVGLGLIQVRQGNDDAAEAIYQKLFTDYPNHPRLAEAINLMAEQYRDRAKAVELEQRKQAGSTPYAVRVATEGRPEAAKSYYRRAIQKWEIIINQLPVSADITPAAYTFAAQSYGRIGDTRKAIEYFSLVAERHPNYQHADYALHMVSRMWEQLQEQQLATESQAWPMIVQASQALLDRYPQSQYAQIARKTVDWITAAENRGKELAHEQQ